MGIYIYTHIYIQRNPTRIFKKSWPRDIPSVSQAIPYAFPRSQISMFPSVLGPASPGGLCSPFTWGFDMGKMLHQEFSMFLEDHGSLKSIKIYESMIS